MRTANICPTCATYINALCVIYAGGSLAYLDLPDESNLEQIVTEINNALQALDNAVNQKQPAFSGYTGSVTIDGTTLNFVNGILDTVS